MDLSSFKNHFQYLIIKGLQPKKRNTCIKGQIQINKKVFDHLKRNGVTGRYKINEKLLTKLKLQLYHHVDRLQYCLCRPDTIKLRVGKQASVQSFNPLRSEEIQFKSRAYIFAFEFIRYEYTN